MPWTHCWSWRVQAWHWQLTPAAPRNIVWVTPPCFQPLCFQPHAALCSGLLPEPGMLKAGFPQAVFGPGQSSLLAACPQPTAPRWLSPYHPANDKAFRRGWIIITARCFSRSPRLAISASSLSHYVRSRKRAGMAQLCAPSGAVGWGTRTLRRAQRGARG